VVGHPVVPLHVTQHRDPARGQKREFKNLPLRVCDASLLGSDATFLPENGHFPDARTSHLEASQTGYATEVPLKCGARLLGLSDVQRLCIGPMNPALCHTVCSPSSLCYCVIVLQYRHQTPGHRPVMALFPRVGGETDQQILSPEDVVVIGVVIGDPQRLRNVIRFLLEGPLSMWPCQACRVDLRLV